MQEAIKRGNPLRISGLFELMAEGLKATAMPPDPWSMVAVEKDQLRKPGRADTTKKKIRKKVEASRRKNR